MALALSGTLSLTTDPAREDYLPRILYENHFLTGAVTASTEQTNYPASLAVDSFTDTAWIGSESETEWWIRVDKAVAAANYLALMAWDLTGCTITPQYGVDTENLLTYSEEFDNAAWVKSAGITVTPNVAVAPDGTTTMDEASLPGGSLDFLYESYAVTPGEQYVFSWYSEAGTLTSPLYGIYDSTNLAWITGPTTYVAGDRHYVAFTVPLTCTSIQAYPLRNNGVDAGTIHLWGAQLHEGSTLLPYIKSEATATSGIVWVDAADSIMTTDRVTAFLFDSVTSDYWRVHFSGTTPPAVANVAVGKAMIMPVGLRSGFEPPKQARNNKITNNETDLGHLAGRSLIRKGIKTQLSFKNLDADFIRDEWEPFIDHAEIRPWYVVWSPVQWPNEVALVWSDRDISAPKYSTNYGHMDVQIQVKGFSE